MRHPATSYNKIYIVSAQLTQAVQKYGGRSKEYHPGSISFKNMAVAPILDPFWSHFGSPRMYIFSNQ